MPREIITVQVGQCGNQSQTATTTRPALFDAAMSLDTRRIICSYVVLRLLCSVGTEFWKRLCAEHGINRSDKASALRFSSAVCLLAAHPPPRSCFVWQ